MSILSKVVTSIFGNKSDKDIKNLKPYVDSINEFYATLQNLSDDEIKNKFNTLKIELSAYIFIHVRCMFCL